MASTLVLNTEIVEKIKTDPILFGKVCQAVKKTNGESIVPSSLTRLLLENHPKLTQAGVLKVLRESLRLNDSELLTELQVA